MATVYVLFGIDKVQKRVFVKVLRKRQLQNHAGYVGIFVEIAYRTRNFVEGAFGREFAKKRLYAHLVARLDFVAHVNLRRRIVPHQNHRKTYGIGIIQGFQSFHFLLNLLSCDFCHEFSVDNLHITPLDCIISSIKSHCQNIPHRMCKAYKKAY